MIVQYALSTWRSDDSVLFELRGGAHIRLAKQCIHIFIPNEKKKNKFQQNKKKTHKK